MMKDLFVIPLVASRKDEKLEEKTKSYSSCFNSIIQRLIRGGRRGAKLPLKERISYSLENPH
jgi:hypothetical protein